MVHDYLFEINCRWVRCYYDYVRGDLLLIDINYICFRLNQLGFDLIGKTGSDVDVNEVVPLEKVRMNFFKMYQQCSATFSFLETAAV